MEFEWLPFPEYYDAPGRVPFGARSSPRTSSGPSCRSRWVSWCGRRSSGTARASGGRNTLSGGQSLIARLAAIVLREGGTILTEHAVERAGHRARPGGGRRGDVPLRGPGQTVHARRGVLIAAGGFEGSDTMRGEHDVPGDVAWTMAPRGTNAGEPIRAAELLGAATDYSALGWFCPGLEHPDGSGSFTLGFRGGLMVDATGRRYANECLPYDRFGREMAKSARPDPVVVRVRRPRGWSAAGDRDARGRPRPTHLAAGTWVRADTLEALAAAIGVPAGRAGRDRRAVQRVRRHRRRRGLRPGRRRVRHVLRRRRGPQPGAHPGRPAAVLRRPLRALRPRHQGRPGHRRGRPGAARGRLGDPGLYASSNSAASVFGSVYPGPGAPLGSAMVFASLAVRDMRG